MPPEMSLAGHPQRSANPIPSSKTLRPVIAAAGDQSHAASIPFYAEPIPVILDFVEAPAGTIMPVVGMQNRTGIWHAG